MTTSSQVSPLTNSVSRNQSLPKAEPTCLADFIDGLELISTGSGWWLRQTAQTWLRTTRSGPVRSRRGRLCPERPLSRTNVSSPAYWSDFLSALRLWETAVEPLGQFAEWSLLQARSGLQPCNRTHSQSTWCLSKPEFVIHRTPLPKNRWAIVHFPVKGSWLWKTTPGTSEH